MFVLDYFLKWEARIPDAIFLRQPTGSDWTDYTWKQVGMEARRITRALQAEGLEPGDRVALLSANCARWIICDLALLMGGFISVPLYANVSPTAMEGILEDSGARFLFIGKLRAADWAQLRSSIPAGIATATLKGYAKEGFRTWHGLTESGTGAAAIVPARGDAIPTIIYTSGTTGRPKGVVQTNHSIIRAVQVAAAAVRLNRPGNRFISYLPLSHAAERGLIEAGGIYCGGTIGFVESLETFADNVRELAPTHFFGVPRIWEKFRDKILEQIPPARLDLLLRIPLLRSLVTRRIKKSMGLYRADVILSGAAPIAPDLIRWFARLDILIREAYGMSENFNVLAMNPADDIRVGTVGTLFPEQEVYIDPDTQEIRQKCDWLMQGYYQRPDLTEAAIVDGFLQTGDMGQLSPDGYLTIIGRVKDIFKTAKGEYITPAPLEAQFLELDLVDQACVMGVGYPQAFILVVLSESGRKLAPSAVGAHLQRALDHSNQEVPEYHKLRKVIVVREEWTPENNLLTPTSGESIISSAMRACCKGLHARYRARYRSEVNEHQLFRTYGPHQTFAAPLSGTGRRTHSCGEQPFRQVRRTAHCGLCSFQACAARFFRNAAQ